VPELLPVRAQPRLALRERVLVLRVFAPLPSRPWS